MTDGKAPVSLEGLADVRYKYGVLVLRFFGSLGFGISVFGFYERLERERIRFVRASLANRTVRWVSSSFIVCIVLACCRVTLLLFKGRMWYYSTAE